MDGPCQLRRQPHKARNRRERELQADARDGVWIFEQDQQQRKAERRRRVLLPPEKRRELRHREHHAGAQDARRRADHHRVEKQQRDRHRAACAPVRRAEQSVKQLDEEHTVQARDGGDVIDARLAQVRRILHVKIALVAEEQGAQKAALPLAVDGLDGLAELPCDALRRIAKRARVTRLIRRLAAAVEQQINALGRKIADVAAVARGIGRAVEKHRVPHVLARLKGEQVEAAVVDGSPAQAAAQDTHRRLRAVIRLHGVGAKLQLHVLRRADERLVRRGDEARVSGVPAEGERHAERTQQHAPPHRAAQEKPERPKHQHNARRRKPQRGREKILRRDAAERKGGAEAKERARHGSSFKPSK